MSADTLDWLRRKAKGLPPLEDLSPEGRRVFLEAHEPTLWCFWREAFELALLMRDPWLDASEALAARRNEREGGKWIAESIIERLRDRPLLNKAPAWEDLEGWYNWLRGRKATQARRRQGPVLSDDSEEAEWSDGSNEQALTTQLDSQRMRAELLALVDEWSNLLARIVQSTGLPSLEVDWLWATCADRAPLAKTLEGEPVDAHFLERSKRALTLRASKHGARENERTARTRRGAAASFRFNLEVFASEYPGLSRAHRVFLGPVADPDESPAKPAAEVGPEEVAGFRETLRLSAQKSGYASREDLIGTLRARVYKATLVKAVARLLPRREREAVERDWAGLVGQVEVVSEDVT